MDNKMNTYVISCSTTLYGEINIIKVCNWSHQLLQHYCSIALISQTPWKCWTLHFSTANDIQVITMDIQFSGLYSGLLSFLLFALILWYQLKYILSKMTEAVPSGRIKKNPPAPTPFTCTKSLINCQITWIPWRHNFKINWIQLSHHWRDLYSLSWKLCWSYQDDTNCRPAMVAPDLDKSPFPCPSLHSWHVVWSSSI